MSNSASPAVQSPARARLRTAEGVDPHRLDAFLRRSFSPAKAHFLDRHGAWWHRSAENRLVLTVDDEIAGYCALMPATCRLGGENIEATWWVDLVIAPEFRSQGLQRIFDQEVRARAPLLLGVPNQLAAAIHRKHGWGVREDLATLMLPLRPQHLPTVRRAQGAKGRLLRAAATLLTPASLVWRWWFSSYQPLEADRLQAELKKGQLDEPELATLAEIAARTENPRQLQTRRDLAYLRWRYGEFPWPDQLRVYVSGPRDRSAWALLARHVPSVEGTAAEGSTGVLRILELFGDTRQPRQLRDVVGLAVRDAARDGLAQVTVLASTALRRSLAPLGFLLSTRSRFCWLSSEPALMARVAHAEPAWSLGDSDNDDIR